MSIAHLLEDYGIRDPFAKSVALSDVKIEELKLDALEQGYRSGWDDALIAQSDGQKQISIDFANNLQDLSFSFHEIQAQVLKSMQPLLSQLVATVLPELAYKTLAPRIEQSLMDVATTQTNQTIQIVVAPQNKAAVQHLVTQDLPFTMAIVEDKTLGAGQVFLRFSESEIQIDLDSVLKDMEQALDVFFNETQPEALNAG